MSNSHFNVVHGPVGNQQISSMNLPDTTARQQPGLIIEAISPYWGGAEFIYAVAGGTIRMFGVCTILQTIASGAVVHTATEVPNTANLGRAVYVAQTSMTVGQYGWFMVSGVTPVNCSAAVAADTAFGITAAGQCGAIANGKQIVNARVVIASTTTVAKTNSSGNASSYQIQVTNADGLFIGCYMSGTGVGTNAKITDITPDGKTITVDVVNSAQITGTVTGTYNNATIYYNVAQLNRPFAQGQVT